METVLGRVPPESWGDRRIDSKGWGSSADPPKLMFDLAMDLDEPLE